MSFVFALLVLLGVIAVGFVIEAQHRGGRASDSDLLERLRLDGSDLSKPHSIEFFLHFPTREFALKIDEVLSSEGFTTSIGPGVGSRYHILLARKVMVPIKSDLAATGARFKKLAAAEGGTYEGWAAIQIVRPAGGA